MTVHFSLQQLSAHWKDFIFSAEEAESVRNMEAAGLMACATPGEIGTALLEQSREFAELSKRLKAWQSRSNIDGEEEQLLADLRLVLHAARIATFDVITHGQSSGLTADEILEESKRHAGVDFFLRGVAINSLKELVA